MPYHQYLADLLTNSREVKKEQDGIFLFLLQGCSSLGTDIFLRFFVCWQPCNR